MRDTDGQGGEAFEETHLELSLLVITKTAGAEEAELAFITPESGHLCWVDITPLCPPPVTWWWRKAGNEHPPWVFICVFTSLCETEDGG